MGQIVKRKRRGRPSNSDRARRSFSATPPSPVDRRRSRRRRKVIYHFDIDDYVDDDEFDDDEEDEEVGRREKKLRLLLYDDDSRSNRRVTHAPESSSSSSSSSSSEDDDFKPSKKLKINGDDDDDNEDDEIDEVRGRKWEDDDGEEEEESASGGSDFACGTTSDLPEEVPLPDKKTLELILDKLQKKDTYGVYAEPVDPEELPDYHDVIKYPMDFATVRKKLAKGSYLTLNEIESDVLLICTNAMQYNAPDTIYYKQASSIQEQAKLKFQRLRANVDQSEIESKSELKTTPSFSLPKKQLKKSVVWTSPEPIGSESFSGGTANCSSGQNPVRPKKSKVWTSQEPVGSESFSGDNVRTGGFPNVTSSQNPVRSKKSAVWTSQEPVGSESFFGGDVRTREFPNGTSGQNPVRSKKSAVWASQEPVGSESFSGGDVRTREIPNGSSGQTPVRSKKSAVWASQEPFGSQSSGGNARTREFPNGSSGQTPVRSKKSAVWASQEPVGSQSFSGGNARTREFPNGSFGQTPVRSKKSTVWASQEPVGSESSGGNARTREFPNGSSDQTPVRLKKSAVWASQEPVGSESFSGGNARTGGFQNGSLAQSPVRPNNIEAPIAENSSLADNNLDKEQELLLPGKGCVSKVCRKPSLHDENRRATYNPSVHPVTESNSIFSTFEGESKQFIPVGLHEDHSYARSLSRFAATLGPAAWKVASRIIEQALPEGVKYGRGWVGEYEPVSTPVLTPKTLKKPNFLTPFQINSNPRDHKNGFNVTAPGDDRTRSNHDLQKPPGFTDPVPHFFSSLQANRSNGFGSGSGSGSSSGSPVGQKREDSNKAASNILHFSSKPQQYQPVYSNGSQIGPNKDDSTNAALTAAQAWMSLGRGGGFIIPQLPENTNPHKQNISSESLYNPGRDRQVSRFAGEFPVQGILLQPHKNSHQQPVPQGNRHVGFPQMVTADLSRFQNPSRQKQQESRPPDLNIGYQSMGSPVRQSTGMMADSQQPDLALQL